jgi:hypothetical protein
MYSPYMQGDLLYAVIVIAVFVGVLLATWVIDRLLTQRSGRPPARLALPTQTGLAVLARQPEPEAHHDDAGQPLHPPPDAAPDHGAELVPKQDDGDQPDDAPAQEDSAE